jgi:hypothetical protein
VVKIKKEPREAMEFLRQCDLIKVDDILPLFQNFDVIDGFKVSECVLCVNVFCVCVCADVSLYLV